MEKQPVKCGAIVLKWHEVRRCFWWERDLVQVSLYEDHEWDIMLGSHMLCDGGHASREEAVKQIAHLLEIMTVLGDETLQVKYAASQRASVERSREIVKLKKEIELLKGIDQ